LFGVTSDRPLGKSETGTDINYEGGLILFLSVVLSSIAPLAPNRSNCQKGLRYVANHGKKYLSRSCPRCNGYVGIVMREPARNTRLQAVNGKCLGCSYRLAWIVIRGRRVALTKRARAQSVGKVVADYLITLSARASTFGGIVRPICLAVLRLITSSNFVGAGGWIRPPNRSREPQQFHPGVARGAPPAVLGPVRADASTPHVQRPHRRSHRGRAGGRLGHLEAHIHYPTRSTQSLRLCYL
jgi:hypothetical protein